MNNYITLDTKKYKCPWKTWFPHDSTVPSEARMMLDGSLDATFGPAVVLTWSGEIIAPNTPEGAGWGTASDLLTSLQKKTTLSFTDHLGTTYTIVSRGTIKRKSLHANWDAASNEFYFNVNFMAVQ